MPYLQRDLKSSASVAHPVLFRLVRFFFFFYYYYKYPRVLFPDKYACTHKPDGIVYDFYRNLISTSAIAVYQSEFYCPTYLCAHSKMSPLVASVAKQPLKPWYRKVPPLAHFSYFWIWIWPRRWRKKTHEGTWSPIQRALAWKTGAEIAAAVKIYRRKLLLM